MFSCVNRLSLNRSLVLGVLVACAAFFARNGAAQEIGDVRVNVRRNGDIVLVRADFSVPVSASQAFAVLTDYDHMHDFLPGVVESRIIQRSPSTLVVSQSVRMKLGMFSIPVEAVRQVELEPPYKLVSRAISGTVSKATVTTTLMEAQGKTFVTYESEATLNSWLPTGIGASIIQTHIQEQLAHMRAEMLRRNPSVAK